jgi:hypothetical protein
MNEYIKLNVKAQEKRKVCILLSSINHDAIKGVKKLSTHIAIHFKIYNSR